MLSKPNFDPVMGLAALDPVVAAHKQFLAKNQGNPDIRQFLMQDQGQKVNPNLAAAMIVLDQMEKAKGGMTDGPPPASTVMDDVAAAGMQAAQQAQARQSGIAGLPNQAMGEAQFQGGIAQGGPPPAGPPGMPPGAPPMQGAPPQGMAGGGIVALAGGGSDFSGVDFSQMTPEQLQTLARDKSNPELADKASVEYLHRMGYSTPGDIVSGYMKAFRGGIGDSFPLIRYDSRKFPSYMYDEKGNVRKGEVTGGIAGTPYYSSSAGPTGTMTPAAAPAAAAGASSEPNAFEMLAASRNLPADPAAAAQAKLTSAMMGGDRKPTGTPTGGGARPTGMAAPAGAAPAATDATGLPPELARDPTLRFLWSQMKGSESPEEFMRKAKEALGPDTETDEYKKGLTERQAKAQKQAEQSKWLALAKAGFTMAGTRGPVSEGISAAGKSFIEDMGNSLKELNATEKDIAEGRLKIAQAARTQKLDLYKDYVREQNSNLRNKQAVLTNIVSIISNEKSSARQLAIANAATDRMLAQLSSNEKINGVKESVALLNEQTKEISNRINSGVLDKDQMKQAETELATANLLKNTLMNKLLGNTPSGGQTVNMSGDALGYFNRYSSAGK